MCASLKSLKLDCLLHSLCYHCFKAQKHATVEELAALLLSVPNWTHPAVVSAVRIIHFPLLSNWIHLSTPLDTLLHSQLEITLKQDY